MFRLRLPGLGNHRSAILNQTAWMTPVMASFLSVVLSVSPTVGAELTWNDAPVVGYARLAPLDRLQRDLAFLSESVDGGTSLNVVKDAIAELSGGIDTARPFGLVVYVDETFNPIIVVPLKDEEKLFAALRSRFGWEFYRGDDGLYRGGNVNAAARVSGAWLYVTGGTHSERLKKTPDDPMRLFENLDSTVTAQAVVLIDQVPPDQRATFGPTILEAFTSSEGAEASNQAGSGLVRQFAQQLLSDSKRLEIELQCFRPLEQFHVTTRLIPTSESKLARWIDATSRRPSTYEHLATDDAAAVVLSAMTLDAETMKPLLDAWEKQAATARASAPSPQAADPASRLIGRLVAQGLDAVNATLRKGELDGGVVIEHRGSEPVRLLAGGALLGSRAIEETALDFAQLLQQAPEFQALGWAASGNGDVSLHQIQIPMTQEGAKRVFGDAPYATVGFGPDRLYGAFGDEEAIAKLSRAIDRSREEQPVRGAPLRVTLRMAPFMALLDEITGNSPDADRQMRVMAEQVAAHKRNDTLEIAAKAADGALETRLRIDMGVVRMFASALPAAPKSPPVPDSAPPSPLPSGGGNLALRAAPAETFQLEFYTDSRTTTKIGDQERVDRGRHSLLYDFRVLNVAADGSLQLLTSLNRVTIHKETPEGKTDFDSANPPKPEQMDAEMLLHALLVNRKLTLTVRSDGTIAKITGIEEAVEAALYNDLKPPANEREQARAFLRQGLNESGLRDSLTRGFEFYPNGKVNVGDRWNRTVENYSGINFLLDNRYQLQSLTAEAAVIGVKSQVREKEQTAAQPVQWDVVGSQSGSILVDPRTGRLQLAEYVLHLQGEATLMMDGKAVVRPIVSEFNMLVGEPERVAEKKGAAK